MGVFADHLEKPGVTEVLNLRSSFGVMAFHGGFLEKVTDLIADEVATATKSSYYGVLHGEDVPTHISSKFVDPADSPALREFLGHVDVAVAIHGYGRDHLRKVILLGGSNRQLAEHIAEQLADDLPKYEARFAIDDIPKELRGLHPDNPVNRPAQGGVQIELPPTLRWNWDERNWSDHGGARRAPQVNIFIESLGRAIRSWDGPGH